MKDEYGVTGHWDVARQLMIYVWVDEEGYLREDMYTREKAPAHVASTVKPPDRVDLIGVSGCAGGLAPKVGPVDTVYGYDDLGRIWMLRVDLQAGSRWQLVPIRVGYGWCHPM